jgi:hypothetical protein
MVVRLMGTAIEMPRLNINPAGCLVTFSKAVESFNMEGKILANEVLTLC